MVSLLFSFLNSEYFLLSLGLSSSSRNKNFDFCANVGVYKSSELGVRQCGWLSLKLKLLVLNFQVLYTEYLKIY